MCGRYAIAYNSEELPSHFKGFDLEVHPKINKNDHFDRSFNVAPTTSGAVYRAKDNELRYMKWGLVPGWTKNVEDFNTYKTFNARLENLQESKMWMACCNRKRCVIPVSGYYEWKTKGKSKVPYYVVRKDGKLLFLAGLYDYLESDDLWSYAIITGKSPKELSWLHHRMPVVLEPGTDAWDTWMDPDKTEWTQDELDDLLAAHYDEDIMQVYQVGTGVNKVSNNNQELVKPILKEDKGKFNVELSATEKRHMKQEATKGQDVDKPAQKKRKGDMEEMKEEEESIGKRTKRAKKEPEEEEEATMAKDDQEVEEEDMKEEEVSEDEDEPYVEENDAEVDEEVMKDEEGEEADEEYLKGDANDVEGSMDEMGDDAIMQEPMVKGAMQAEQTQSKASKGGQSIGDRVRNEVGESSEGSAEVKDETEQGESSQKHRGKARNMPGKSSEKGDVVNMMSSGRKASKKRKQHN